MISESQVVLYSTIYNTAELGLALFWNVGCRYNGFQIWEMFVFLRASEAGQWGAEVLMTTHIFDWRNLTEELYANIEKYTF